MTQVLTRDDAYLLDFRALEKSFLADGQAWFHPLRQQAWSRFVELGFPTATRGNEQWKYTSVRPIAHATFRHPLDLRPDDVQQAAAIRDLAPGDGGWLTFVFVNGRYAPGLSTAPAGANGAGVMSLAGAMAADRHGVERHLARYATFEADAFTALNTAFFQDGAFVSIPEDVSLPSPVHLVFVTPESAQPTVSYPRTLIVAGRRSRLTVIESYIGRSGSPYFTDAVTEIVAGEGARIDHYRILLESPSAFHVGVSKVRQEADSALSSTTFAVGAALARNDFHVLLDAPGSSCVLNGLYRLSGREHIDNHMNVDHAKPYTTSQLYYKGILDGTSAGVFSGRVLVRPNAQKVNAQQHDRNLILSREAQAYTKPSLEIFADDVRCYHGAAAGDLEEDALFYMRSRGLDQETARKLLILAFASEIIETVQVGPLRAYLERLFSGALPGFQFGEAAR
ncbi:MAG: Fe-S cluster assembly protein SufD [Chloroflexi bacterium]|nr:Fe-S cluster assembly protein SufD [Chloroflexota bacterium]